MGSELDDGFIGISITITISHNSSRSILTAESSRHSAFRSTTDLNSESESHVTTDGQTASLSWNKAPSWGLRLDLYYCLTVAGLLIWGALSDERTGLSFAVAIGSTR
jgi:hypothetical protein